MTERKLASLQRVAGIQPIEGADAIVLSKVLGWSVITKLDEVQEGDTVVFLEIDSLIDPDCRWLPESFRKYAPTRKRKRRRLYHLRTFRLNKFGVISEGLIVPLSLFPEDTVAEFSSLEIGTDLTSRLRIEKYEPPIFVGRGGGTLCETKAFPLKLLSKTGEVRVKSEPHLLEQLVGHPAYATLKYDGTSATYLLTPPNYKPRPQEFFVCSHNLLLLRPAKIEHCSSSQPYWPIALQYELEAKLRAYQERTGRYLALQGEICGPKIQRNLLGLAKRSFYVFNVIELDDGEQPTMGRRLPYPQWLDICQELDLPHVQIEMVWDSFPADISIEQLEEMSKGFYEGTENHREGLVFREQDTPTAPLFKSISFKVISADYRLMVKM